MDEVNQGPLQLVLFRPWCARQGRISVGDLHARGKASIWTGHRRCNGDGQGISREGWWGGPAILAQPQHVCQQGQRGIAFRRAFPNDVPAGVLLAGGQFQTTRRSPDRDRKEVAGNGEAADEGPMQVGYPHSANRPDWSLRSADGEVTVSAGYWPKRA